MMSLTFGLFTQVRGLGPLGPLVLCLFAYMLVLTHFGESLCAMESFLWCKDFCLQQESNLELVDQRATVSQQWIS